MSEDDWLWNSNPFEMLRFVEDRTGDRRLRLFGIACCRAYSADGGEAGEAHVPLLDRAELVADGTAPGERDPLWLALYETQLDARRENDFLLACLHAAFTGKNRHFFKDPRGEIGTVSEWVREACRLLVERPHHRESRSNRHFREMERLRQADIAREIFGNPFSADAFEPGWRTSTVAELAQSIYAEKRFEHLPILADALQDAGCAAESLLDHLRSERTHYRGCWALDAVRDGT